MDALLEISKVDKDTEKTEDLELKIQKDAQQQGDDDAEAIMGQKLVDRYRV